MPRKHSRSPAALILARHGIFQRDVASGLNISVSAVSAILQGRIRPSSDFYTAVRTLAGEEAVNELSGILDGARP